MHDIIYLEVPFSEKEQAKTLGAWWDPVAKKWFVPRGKPVQPFQQWIPTEDETTERESKRK